jgi:hypothetical protein
MIGALSQNQGAYWSISITAQQPAVRPMIAAGFNSVIFFDDFDTTATIDLANSQANGFKWYLANWFTAGSQATNANNVSVANSVLTIGGGSGVGPTIVSAFDTGVTDAFKGTVFGTGGYFEIRMKFDPSLNGGSAGGAPNFYSMAIEHIADNSTVSAGHWPGQAAGYAHFIEVDLFEPLAGSTTTYNASVHDWGGIFVSTQYPQNIVNLDTNVVHVGGVDFTKFHTYGCLWVPQSGATPGRLQRYFDDLLVQTIYFLGPTGSPPLPGDTGQNYSPSTSAQADRTYSVLDGQRLALLLGGGATWPILVDWVKVWK